MPDTALYVAFLWHMHQPYYEDSVSGKITMPWVRLHAIKDYLDMVEILNDFPNLHQTFNVAPSLLDQLEHLLDPNLPKDMAFELTLKKSVDLSEEEKIFLLKNFFMANWETMIKPFPRYYDLLVKRGKHLSNQELQSALRRFTKQDYTDLQVLFNLAWFDPSYREKDSQLNELNRKGKYYSDEDKKIILGKQTEIMQRIIPVYKKMQEDGRIELSVTPFYHPILPLLCNFDIAKISSPQIRLPKVIFNHAEDARFQVKSAVNFYTEHFKVLPRGMWPSEGSVSEEVINIVREEGFKWIATDEEILFKSLGKYKTQEDLYKPYSMRGEKGDVSLIFRDKALSDLIGFVYQNWPPQKAAADMINRFHAIRESLPKDKGPFLVSIILDGENAWEYYPNDGRDFLFSLYKNLNNDNKLKLVTVSEFLERYPAEKRLNRLYPGSWINANFSIWIGHAEDNRAWEYLEEARKTLNIFQGQNSADSLSDNIQRAWKEIYIAEGSDWNWWYGEDHSSANDEEFDKLFRTHISNVYTLIGQKPPDYLLIPIKGKKAKIIREPSALLSPVIDGIDTNYFEWINAGLLDAAKCGGTMHQSETIIKSVYFGFDLETAYFRFDLAVLSDKEYHQKMVLSLIFIEKGIKVSLPLFRDAGKSEYTIFEKKEDDSWSESKKEKGACFNKIIELAIKFKDIKAKQADSLKVLVIVEKEGLIIEQCPEHNPIQIILPDADYEYQFWTV